MAIQEIQNIPYATQDSLPLTPELGSEKKYTEVEADTTAVTHVLQSGTRLIEVQSADYDVRFRYLTASDTDACTSGNAMGSVQAGSFRQFQLPLTGAVSISLLALGTTNVVIIEY